MLLLAGPSGLATLAGSALLPSEPPVPASSSDDRATALASLGSETALKVLIFNDWSCGTDLFGAWFRPPLKLSCGQDVLFYRWDFRQNISAMDAVLISLGQSKLLPPSTDLGAPRGPYNAAPSPQLKRPGQKWFGCSKENGRSYGATSEADLRAVYGIDYMMDYRLSADQPQTFFSQFFVGEYARTLKPPTPANTIRKLAVMQAKCGGDAALGENAAVFQTRLNFIHRLAAVVPTDSMGPCMHNAEPRLKFDEFGGALGRRPAQFHYNKMENVRGYMFTLAAESVETEDWVTEKVYQALAVGSVPVYKGAPNVEKFLPCRDCIINANDFGSPEALGSHLNHLLTNTTAYNLLLGWTRREYRPEDFPFFEKHVRANSFDRSACHLCEALRPGQCNCEQAGCSDEQARLITDANPGTHG